jgi:hypothetical protein
MLIIDFGIPDSLFRGVVYFPIGSLGFEILDYGNVKKGFRFTWSAPLRVAKTLIQLLAIARLSLQPECG